jgi:outer membrane lipoprotein-sorting protein
VFGSRRALHWLVPAAAAVAVIAGGATAGTIVARADRALPPRSAAELLADLRNADVDGFSGTIVQSADLGLPAVGSLARGAGNRRTGGAADLAGLFTGTSTIRIWYGGPDRQRLALLNAHGETDVIRNGAEAWLWNSTDRMASHLTLPVTPMGAAAALASAGSATAVSTAGVTEVAGRDAYELVLTPRDPVSLIGRVNLAVDAEHHLPLRVDVYPRNATRPAARVAFQQISFVVPDREQFVFKSPPGTTITEGDVHAALPVTMSLLGAGWTSVLTARLPAPDGRRRVFAGTLVSVLVMADGRLYAGAVTPARLGEVAGP